jgi:hypothetical protein
LTLTQTSEIEKEKNIPPIGKNSSSPKTGGGIPLPVFILLVVVRVSHVSP